MIAELRDEIYTVLQTVSGLEPHYMKADQDSDLSANTTVPYVVFSEVIDNRARLDTQTGEAIVPVQFDFYGAVNGLSALETIYESAKTALLDKTNYSFTAYDFVDIYVDFSIPVPQSDATQISLQITYKLEVI